jgi:hypothetical protein
MKGIWGYYSDFWLSYTGLTRDKINTDNDLTEIKGTYLRYSFKDNTGFRNFTHQYYIWTKEYSNAFQIKADYLRIFDRQEFTTNIRLGDSLNLTIPKRLYETLNSGNKVLVTSIEKQGKIYLNKNEVLEIENDLATSKSDYYLGTMYFVAGLFLYFKRRLNANN